MKLIKALSLDHWPVHIRNLARGKETLSALLAVCRRILPLLFLLSLWTWIDCVLVFDRILQKPANRGPEYSADSESLGGLGNFFFSFFLLPSIRKSDTNRIAALNWDYSLTIVSIMNATSLPCCAFRNLGKRWILVSPARGAFRLGAISLMRSLFHRCTSRYRKAKQRHGCEWIFGQGERFSHCSFGVLNILLIPAVNLSRGKVLYWQAWSRTEGMKYHWVTFLLRLVPLISSLSGPHRLLFPSEWDWTALP